MNTHTHYQRRRRVQREREREPWPCITKFVEGLRAHGGYGAIDIAAAATAAAPSSRHQFPAPHHSTKWYRPIRLYIVLLLLLRVYNHVDIHRPSVLLYDGQLLQTLKAF